MFSKLVEHQKECKQNWSNIRIAAGLMSLNTGVLFSVLALILLSACPTNIDKQMKPRMPRGTSIGM